MTCLRGCVITLVALVPLFSTVRFQMAYPRGCIVALIAFVWFFSTVDFQMCPQTACLRGFIGCICLTFLRCVFSNVPSKHLPEKMHSHTALVAFVWLFSTMSFQMYPQFTCFKGCIITGGETLCRDNCQLIGMLFFHTHSAGKNNRN